MQNAQERLINQIESFMQERGIETAISYGYSNVGSIYLYSKRDSKVAFGKIFFDFQSSSYKFRITLGGIEINSQPNRTGYSDFLEDYDKPTLFWDVLAAELDKRSFKVKPKRQTAKATDNT